MSNDDSADSANQLVPEPAFYSDIEWFVNHVSSLRRMLPPFAAAATNLTERNLHDFDQFVEKYGTDKVYDEDSRLSAYAMPVEYSSRHRRHRNMNHDSAIFMVLLPRMALVTLVSVFDAYLGHLVRDMLRVRPELLNLSNRQLAYSELFDFQSLDEAREQVVEHEVDSLLRDSHTAQFEWLEKRLNTKLRHDLPVWSEFVEITERRNLFVHCDGVVNSHYLRSCSRAEVASSDLPSLGEKLNVSPDYFQSACNAMVEIGVKLGQVMWRRLVPNDQARADQNLIQVTYELLIEGENQLAEILGRFGITPPLQNATNEHSLYLRVNLLITLKAQGKFDEFQCTLEKVDWTPLADKFKLARASLTEDWDEAARLMRQIGRDGEVEKSDYQDWPLFQWFRDTSKFRDTYEEVFGEPYRVSWPPVQDADDRPNDA